MDGEVGPPAPAPGGWGGGDDMLDELKPTAADREWDATRRRDRRLTRAVIALGALLAVGAVLVAVKLLTSGPPSLHLPARVGDFSRVTSPALDQAMAAGLQQMREHSSKVDSVDGAFYGTEGGRPQVLVMLLWGEHTPQDVSDLRASMEAPIFGQGTPSKPDGPHTRLATVHGVDFVCEPVIENSATGPIGERTDCTWDDHSGGVGVVVDFFSGESDVVLQEVEAIQPGAIS